MLHGITANNFPFVEPIKKRAANGKIAGLFYAFGPDARLLIGNLARAGNRTRHATQVNFKCLDGDDGLAGVDVRLTACSIIGRALRKRTADAVLAGSLMRNLSVLRLSGLDGWRQVVNSTVDVNRGGRGFVRIRAIVEKIPRKEFSLQFAVTTDVSIKDIENDFRSVNDAVRNQLAVDRLAGKHEEQEYPF